MPLSTWECKWVPANFKENMIGNAEGGGGGGGGCGIASHLIELAVILVDKHSTDFAFLLTPTILLDIEN